MNVTRMRVWMGVFVTLVFLSGLAIGVAGGLWAGTRANVWALAAPPPPEGRAAGDRPRFATARILDRLAREDPNFTDEQRSQLEAVFEARRREFTRVAREMRQRYTAEQGRLRDQVEEILSPEQMEIFDNARQRFRRGPRPGRDRPER